MMDHFLEEVAVKRNNTINRILYALSWVVIVVSGLLAFIELNGLLRSFSVPDLILALVFGGIAVYLYMTHDRILTEYEYTFTNGTLDFAEVYNNKKRKNLGSLNVKTVEAFGKVSSGSFHRYVSMPGLKKMNWFLNREAELYYFFFSKDNNKKMIVFEPSAQMVSYIEQYLPKGAYQNN